VITHLQVDTHNIPYSLRESSCLRTCLCLWRNVQLCITQKRLKIYMNTTMRGARIAIALAKDTHKIGIHDNILYKPTIQFLSKQ